MSLEIQEPIDLIADSSRCDLDQSGVFPPVLDAIQDHPAALDWRLVVAFVALGIAALYLF